MGRQRKVQVSVLRVKVDSFSKLQQVSVREKGRSVWSIRLREALQELRQQDEIRAVLHEISVQAESRYGGDVQPLSLN
jgi:hypothetical protein